MAIMDIDKNLETILNTIDINSAAPEEEPLRQYYFIKKIRLLVSERSVLLGRPLTACIQTFGCQMNTDTMI